MRDRLDNFIDWVADFGGVLILPIFFTLAVVSVVLVWR